MRVDIDRLILIFDELYNSTEEKRAEGRYWLVAKRNDGMCIDLIFSIYELNVSVSVTSHSGKCLMSLNFDRCKEIKILDEKKKCLEIIPAHERERCLLSLSGNPILEYK